MYSCVYFGLYVWFGGSVQEGTFFLGFLTKLSFIGWDLFEKLHSWQSIRKITQSNPILKNLMVVSGEREGWRRQRQIINWRDEKCILLCCIFGLKSLLLMSKSYREKYIN